MNRSAKTLTVMIATMALACLLPGCAFDGGDPDPSENVRTVNSGMFDGTKVTDEPTAAADVRPSLVVSAGGFVAAVTGRADAGASIPVLPCPRDGSTADGGGPTGSNGNVEGTENPCP